MKPSKISFYTLGCRLNQSETAGIQNSFEDNGYKVVDFKEPADIVVINTCTVTENGDADTRRLVNKANRINPDARIALIGCQAQVQKDKLADMPNVRWIIGNERKMELVDVFNEYPEPATAQVVAPTVERKPFTIETAGVDRQHTRANIKIQDGCDFFCSFCEIPYARGRARSRVFDDILLESNALVAAGHKEIVITGINVGTYDYENKTILDVVQALHEINGLERIRISSIEPTTIPMDLFDLMTEDNKLCRYLHIPIQSGDDEVLKRMDRKYGTKEFLSFIEEVHAKVSYVCIGTDVIVGFPGETDEQFQNTFDLLLDAPVDYFHVFSYSARYMAKSRNFKEIVPVEKIQERSQILRDLSVRKRRVFYEANLDQTHQVLFEQIKDGFWTGVTDNYIRVKVKSDHDLQNQLLPVRLESIDRQMVEGRLI